MRLNDAVWGALLLLFSAVLFVHVQSFPTIPGQRFGPALFPGVLAVALGVCSVLLLVNGVSARRTSAESAAWIAFAPWTRQGHYALAFLVTIGVNVFYILAVDRLGFVLVGIVYIVALLWVYGAPRKWILPVAVIATLVIHYAFYKLLRVPLPWGVMQGVAW